MQLYGIDSNQNCIKKTDFHNSPLKVFPPLLPTGIGDGKYKSDLPHTLLSSHQHQPDILPPDEKFRPHGKIPHPWKP